MKTTTSRMVRAFAALVAFAAPAAFAENVWTYYAKGAADNPTNQGEVGTVTNEACIANADWTFSVNSWNTSTGALYLRNVFLKDGYDESAEKIIDLRGVTVVSAADSTRTAVTSLRFDKNASAWRRAPIREIYADNLGTPCELSLGARSEAGANQHLRKVWLEGDAVKSVSGENFYFCKALTNLVMRFPNCTKYGGSIASKCSLTNDITELVSPVAGEIGQGAFSGLITGSLVMTNHTGSIYGIAGLSVTNVYLSGPYSGSNGTLSEQIFRGLDTFKTVTFKWPNIRSVEGGYASLRQLREFTVEMPGITNVLDRMFSSAIRLEKLTMLGATVPAKVVDEFLYGVPDFAADAETATSGGVTRGRAILYCSRKQGWKALASPLTEGTYEKTAAPAGCFGIWQTQDGKRKAWMVHLPQDGDPRVGAVIVVR